MQGEEKQVENKELLIETLLPTMTGESYEIINTFLNKIFLQKNCEDKRVLKQIWNSLKTPLKERIDEINEIRKKSKKQIYEIHYIYNMFNINRRENPSSELKEFLCKNLCISCEDIIKINQLIEIVCVLDENKETFFLSIEEYKDFLNEYSYEEIKKAQECILAYEEIDTEDELYEYYREWLGTINKETLYTIYRGLDVFVEFSQFEWELLLALHISNEREVEILLDSVFVMQKVNRLEENISDYIQLTKIVSGRKDNERAFIKEELINEILKSFTFDILFDLRECFEKMKVCGKNELISEETWKKFCVLLVFVKEEEQLKKINSFIKKKEKAKTDI